MPQSGSMGTPPLRSQFSGAQEPQPRKPPYPRAQALQQEKPPQEVHGLQRGSSLCSPQLKESLRSNKDCPTVKINKSFFFNGILGMWSHIWKVFRIQKGTQKAWVTYVTLQC